jgi:hypothetical protein
MHLEHMRDKNKVFPIIENPETFTSARIWHCSYKSLEPISKLTNLRNLVIASYPDSTLEFISTLENLEVLEILHLPNINSLAPLSRLKKLTCLSLSTLPSWDASRKTTSVDTLEPITMLPLLEKLSLLGVVPISRTTDMLLNCKTLKHIRISQYPKSEQEKIYTYFAV